MKVGYRGAVGVLTADQRKGLLERGRWGEGTRGDAVAQIIRDVRSHGDAALYEMAKMFDGCELDGLEVPRARWQEARGRLSADLIDAMGRSARNLETFHRALVPPPVEVETEAGVVLERRTVPLTRAGVYAPGGRAVYASSVLMGVVAARAAGVPEVVVCSPPQPGGAVDDSVLAAAEIGGVSRVFAVGGAGAVAAMAYGTESVPACDVVVGPGNHWVNEAKRQVAGDVRIDSPAGPSELLILADGGADPDVVIRELVAQAEHDPDAAVVMVSTSEALVAAVAQGLPAAVAATPRMEVVRAALAAQGGLLTAGSDREAVEFVNAYAPEHLLLIGENCDAWLSHLRTAGTVFVGASSSVSFGDYVSGANHVLPTGGLARVFSGLSAEHFVRSFTVQRISPDGAARLSAPTKVFATAEGLPGHAAAAAAHRVEPVE